MIAGTAPNTGDPYIAQTPGSTTFDLDAPQDGRWTYTWDGEIRLIALESLDGAPNGSNPNISSVVGLRKAAVSTSLAGELN